MRKYVGFYDNGVYRVGCSGAKMHVMDQNGEKLAEFKDLKYAYYGAFQPGTNLFVLKSTEGRLAVYNLDDFSLMEIIKVPGKLPQDGGFAFSADGRHFWNIEAHKNKGSCLAVYSCPDFKLENVYFDNAENLHLNSIEACGNPNEFYLLASRCTEGGATDVIVFFKDGRVCGEKEIEDKCFAMWLLACKKWQASGFTQKTREFLCFEILGEPRTISLREEYEKL